MTSARCRATLLVPAAGEFVSMHQLPSDLVPLPTQPWDKRPEAVPLDNEEVRTALWMHRGNVTEAAKVLKTTAARLRSKVKASQYLTRELEEAREQLKDIAEDVVYEALTDDQDKGRRDSMARFVLSSQGRDRGYGTGQTKVNINNGAGGKIVIGWEDGSNFNDPPQDDNVIEGEAVEVSNDA